MDEEKIGGKGIERKGFRRLERRRKRKMREWEEEQKR